MKKLPLILGGMLVVSVLAMLFLKPDVPIQQKVASGPTKVGFVYLTNPGDHGWTYAHEVGRQELQAHFGDKVETSYVENVPEGPDAARVIRELAEKGNKVIFTTSFGYMDPTIRVAKEYPDVHFDHITGYKRSANVATGNIRFYEGPFQHNQTISVIWGRFQFRK